ncbi:protein lin1 [Anaeramoeba flamelloides]|uniref:Protein lin1 n=1 Tax=Anaeramoeba flamelloides TaxID=1746091 RepID=A0AAV7YJB9_9EUKA|nr:protein lin1 [Anaeramoeba flamelloides]
MLPKRILKERKKNNSSIQKNLQEISNSKHHKMEGGNTEESLNVNNISVTDKTIIESTLEFDVVERTISRKVMEKYNQELNAINNKEQKARTLKVNQIMSSQLDYPYSFEAFSMTNDRDQIEFDKYGNVLPKPIEELVKKFKSMLLKGELSQKELENWEDTLENSNKIVDCGPSSTNIEDDIEIEKLIVKMKESLIIRKRRRPKNGLFRRKIPNSEKERSINRKLIKNQTNDLEKKIERELDQKEEDLTNEKVLQKEKEKEKDNKAEENDQKKKIKFILADQKIVLENIINLLNNGETPLTALKRFGGLKMKRISCSRRKFRKKKLNQNKQIPKKRKTVETTKDESKFNLLSDYIQKAIGFGSYDIYHLTKEQLLDQIKKYQVQTLGDCWLYRWRNKKSDKVYGPYTTEEMNRWLDLGFFYSVYVKRIGEHKFRKIQKIGRFY